MKFKMHASLCKLVCHWPRALPLDLHGETVRGSALIGECWSLARGVTFCALAGGALQSQRLNDDYINQCNKRHTAFCEYS